MSIEFSVSAFEVWHKDFPGRATVLNALSASKARYQHYLEVSDAWNEVQYLDFRCRKIGKPSTTKRIESLAKYVNLPFVRAGMNISMNGDSGIIVDVRSGYWVVLFTSGMQAV